MDTPLSIFSIPIVLGNNGTQGQTAEIKALCNIINVNIVQQYILKNNRNLNKPSLYSKSKKLDKTI